MDADKEYEQGRCYSCVIRRKGLCNALTEDELLRFRKIANRRIYEPGQSRGINTPASIPVRDILSRRIVMSGERI